MFERQALMTRRTAMQSAGAFGLAAATGACAPQPSSAFGPAPEWMTLLGKSEKGGRDYAPRIEGELPTGLRGALYRNGPGLFERGDQKIKHLLDGDGLIQKLTFADGGVRYQNKFVATEKYKREEVSGVREFATWTTRKNDNPFSNLGGGVTETLFLVEHGNVDIAEGGEGVHVEGRRRRL